VFVCEAHDLQSIVESRVRAPVSRTETRLNALATEHTCLCQTKYHRLFGRLRILQDVLMLVEFQEAKFVFVAHNLGLMLFHYHQKLHVDFGFMALLKYA
jgi:hypothetical protein